MTCGEQLCGINLKIWWIFIRNKSITEPFFYSYLHDNIQLIAIWAMLCQCAILEKESSNPLIANNRGLVLEHFYNHVINYHKKTLMISHASKCTIMFLSNCMDSFLIIIYVTLSHRHPSTHKLKLNDWNWLFIYKKNWDIIPTLHIIIRYL